MFTLFLLDNKHKKNKQIIYVSVYQEILKHIPETCENCLKSKTNKQRIRNCGFIDEESWKGPSFGKEDAFEKWNISFTECPNSIKSRNYFAIQYIMFLSKEGNPTLELSFLQNSAIMDFNTANSIFNDIKREKTKPTKTSSSSKRSL